MTHTRRRPTTSVPIRGARVRELRIEQGTSVGDFAGAVGISPSYLRGIELGHASQVSPAVYNAILKALKLRDRKLLQPDAEKAGVA